MKLWLMWGLASAVGFGIGGRLGTAFAPSRDLIVIGYLAISAALILSGVLQWMLLRELISGAGRWVLASVAAVAVVGVLVFGLGQISRDVGWVLGVVLGWIALGALQWLVLRGQLAGAGWWVPATALGLIVAIPTVGLVTWVAGAPDDTALGGFLRWVAFGGAYGVVTATALWWLLRERLELATP